MFNSKIFYFILVFLYNIILVFLYQDYIYPKYSYFGMQYNESYNLYLSLLVNLLSSLLVFFMPRYIEKPSDILLAFSYFFIFLPALNVGYVSLSKANDYFFYYFLFMFLNIFILIAVNKTYVKSSYLVSFNTKTNNFIFFSVSFLLYILVFLYYKPDINNILSLEDVTGVYDLREDYREKNVNYPTIVVYAFTWLIRFFTPLILIYGLINKNKLVVVLSFFLTVLLFSVSGHKSIILGFFLVLVSYLLFSKKEKITFYILFNFYFCCLLISTILYKFFNFDLLINAFVRRTMHVPGILSIFYYEFFSQNDKTYLAYSILKGLVDYPYQVTPPFIIGSQYFGRSDMSANVNYIMANYADFGFFGGIVFTLLCAMMFRLLDSIYRYKVDNPRFLALIILPAWALVNSSFITVFITHGLVLVFLYFLVCNTHEKK